MGEGTRNGTTIVTDAAEPEVWIRNNWKLVEGAH